MAAINLVYEASLARIVGNKSLRGLMRTTWLLESVRVYGSNLNARTRIKLKYKTTVGISVLE